MNKEEIKYIKTENGYKVNMPLITDDELETIDFNFHSIVDEYIKEFSNRREKTIEQRLIYDLEQENKQLKDNWDKLKEYIKETKIKEFEKTFGKKYGKTFTQAEIIICNMINDKMQELESGNSNE